MLKRSFPSLVLVLILMWAATGQAFAASQPQPTPKPDEQTYIIGPSDLLEIVTWREEAVSRNDILVRPDGKFSLPLIDDVQAAGLTPMQLKEKLKEAMGKVIEAPQPYVIVKDPRSHQFNVLGNVAQPGNYPMLLPTTVLQALAAAGGFNEWAAKDDVVVIRGHGEEQKRFEFDYSEVIKGEKVEQNILLEPGDVVIVP